MKDENCIFCKLANGDIPTATLYEDEDFRVILDASPASKGHALISWDAMDIISFRTTERQQVRQSFIFICI